ncbi:MAG: SWIM zinc finger family protein, partial [Lachnospiraceae bacterium]|nr:SWIM zinc finger family protein [Lachnospiraceae bacterium]
MTSLRNGKQLFERKKVKLEKNGENEFSAKIFEYKTYHVKILVRPESRSYKIKCDCPVATGGRYCKHMAAAMYAMEYMENYSEKTKPENQPEQVPEEEMNLPEEPALVEEIISERPDSET